MSVTAIAANQLDNLAAEVAPPLRDKLRAIAATLRTVPTGQCTCPSAEVCAIADVPVWKCAACTS